MRQQIQFTVSDNEKFILVQRAHINTKSSLSRFSQTTSEHLYYASLAMCNPYEN